MTESNFPMVLHLMFPKVHWMVPYLDCLMDVHWAIPWVQRKEMQSDGKLGMMSVDRWVLPLVITWFHIRE